MRPSSRARSSFLLLYGALLVWQVDRWCFTPHGLVSTWSGDGVPLAVSAGSPLGVVQTFTMGADGLDGVWLRATTDGRRPQGELVVDLSERRGRSTVRLERVALPASEATAASAVHVPFRPIRHSRGVQYELHVRHLHIGDGPALDLATTREDRLPLGRLFADGRERWGDLLLETSARRATLPYWLHETLRGWPTWARAWPVVVGLVLLFNALLAWACARATGLIADGDAGQERAPSLPVGASTSRRAPVHATRVAYSAAAVVAIGGLIVAVWPTPRDRSLDLIAALPEASIDTTWESVHGAVAFRFTDFPGARVRTIHALPTTRLAWTVDVPQAAVFRVGAAMRPDLWTANSDGIQMHVSVIADGQQTLLTTLTLFPLGVPEHRRLVPVDLSLHPWAGRRITLVLEATPERAGNAVNDAPVWVEPRITWPRRPSAGEARIVPPGA